MSQYVHIFCSVLFCFPSVVHIQSVLVEEQQKKTRLPQGHRGRLYEAVTFQLVLRVEFCQAVKKRNDILGIKNSISRIKACDCNAVFTEHQVV